MKVCLSGDAFTGEVGNEREDNVGNREGVVKDERGGKVCGIFQKLQEGYYAQSSWHAWKGGDRKGSWKERT